MAFSGVLVLNSLLLAVMAFKGYVSAWVSFWFLSVHPSGTHRHRPFWPSNALWIRRSRFGIFVLLLLRAPPLAVTAFKRCADVVE